MAAIPPFRPATLELLSEIFGATEDGFSGSELHRLILQANMDDVSYNEEILAKRKKLYNAFANEITIHHCSNNIK